jgi:hypothetical protein
MLLLQVSNRLRYREELESKSMQYSRVEQSVPRVLFWIHVEWDQDVDGQRDNVSLRQNSTKRDTNDHQDRKCDCHRERENMIIDVMASFWRLSGMPVPAWKGNAGSGSMERLRRLWGGSVGNELSQRYIRGLRVGQRLVRADSAGEIPMR